MRLAFSTGMNRRPPQYTVLLVVFSILSAPALGANTPIDVDVDRGAEKACVVDAAFDVNVPAPIAWGVLTDDEGVLLEQRAAR